MHHHGYSWLGTGLHHIHDGARRAGHPDFIASPVPPLELAQWLLKAAAFVRGTWREPQQAAAWFGAQVRPYAEVFDRDHDREALEERITAAAEAVAGGADVAGGWWLVGRRYLGVYLIACRPHRFRPEYPCPAPAPPGRVPQPASGSDASQREQATVIRVNEA
ncbi:hypothetical protein [Streptomyces fradiae]|uniref:hypothetical protein n=1 Tax=Streptomyces fradiae TaxID=1906 RepID=UPI003790E2E6